MMVVRLGGIRGVVEHAARLLVCHGGRSRAASSARSRRRSLLLCRDGAFQDVWSIGKLLVLPGVWPCELNSARTSRRWCNVTCMSGRPTPKAPSPRTSTHLHRLNSRALRNHHNHTPLFY